MTGQAEHRRIVVGVDGSPPGDEAVRWAVRQARLMDAEVEIVHGWQVPTWVLLTPTSTDVDYGEHHRQILQAAVARAVGDVADVRVNTRMIEHKPAAALVSAARGADLLVVGSHGRGEFPGMHLGSVANYCVHHAPCPVVVVREAVDR